MPNATLINCFQVPEKREAEFLDLWQEAEALLRAAASTAAQGPPPGQPLSGRIQLVVATPRNHGGVRWFVDSKQQTRRYVRR